MSRREFHLEEEVLPVSRVLLLPYLQALSRRDPPVNIKFRVPVDPGSKVVEEYLGIESVGMIFE